MAQIESTTDTKTTERDGASVSTDAFAANSAKVAAARQQVLEFARALARLAAQEDDAAEHNDAGPAARSEASTASTRRKGP